MRRARPAAVAFAVLLCGACETAPEPPPPPPTHPANPRAEEAPRPAPSATLRLEGAAHEGGR